MKKMLLRIIYKIFRSFAFKYMFCNYQCYRRWYGGRWEKHWIEICHSSMWLDMKRQNVWPDFRQPCSFGTPLIEDYPDKVFI